MGNSSVALIKLSSTEGKVLFFTIYFSEKSYVGLTIGKDNMLFTPHYVLSTRFTQSDRQKMCSLYNLAKSTLYLHSGTFVRGPLCAGVHKSVLSLDTADEEHSEWGGWI